MISSTISSSGGLRRVQDKLEEAQCPRVMALPRGKWHPPLSCLDLILDTCESSLSPLPNIWWGSGPASAGERVGASLTQFTHSASHRISSTALEGKFYPQFTDAKTLPYNNGSVIIARLILPALSPRGNVTFTYHFMSWQQKFYVSPLPS